VKSESGPDHHKRFLVEVRTKGEAGERGEPLARGTGHTKKLAEQDAARRALELLKSAGARAVNDATLRLEGEIDTAAEIDTAVEEPSVP
jgi:ribonuclease-3